MKIHKLTNFTVSNITFRRSLLTTVIKPESVRAGRLDGWTGPGLLKDQLVQQPGKT
jgi:hypothetical protein